MHLIVVQSADGSLVVGDSHHYGAAPDPFAREEIDALILRGIAPRPRESSRHRYWSDGSVRMPRHPIDRYSSIRRSGRVRLAIVTCGAGMSSGFAHR